MVVMNGDDGDAGVVRLALPRPGAHRAASVGRARTHVLRAATPNERAATNDERRQMVRAARSLLEDIGSMHTLSRHTAEAASSEHVERMLDAFDALATLGASTPGAPRLDDLNDVISSYGREVDPPDPPRAFAAAFARAHLRVRGGAP
ncbi:MAG: hypothetical protein U0271_15740 [Polyangiaceae bacterium]